MVAEPQHEGGYRIYLVVWFWLLVITVLEVGVVLVHVPKLLLATLLLTMSLMKAALIIAYFMHLKYERLTFIYAIVLPLFLAVILFFGVGPDAVHVLTMRR